MTTAAFNAPVELSQAVSWRPSFWLAPTRFVIGDPMRFRGKRVLDLGSRDGSMARYFQSLGAKVEVADVNNEAVEQMRLSGLHGFLIDRYWNGLPSESFDFIFTKSVLVLAPRFVPALLNIQRSLKPTGEYLAVENWTSPVLEVARYIVNRRKFSKQFSYINYHRLCTIQDWFGNIDYRFGPFECAIGIRATAR